MTPTLTVEFSPAEYDRLLGVTDDLTTLVHDAAMKRVDLDEAIAFTRAGGFAGPKGFDKLADDDTPTWPFGALCGIEMVSMSKGKSRWILDAGPEHANPMGTIHGGVLCDLGDAALSTAYMSTVDSNESFTTVDLAVKFLRPVWTDRLEAVGRVVHKGRTIGLAECEITNGDGKPVARLSGTCMTLRTDAADRREATPGTEADRPRTGPRTIPARETRDGSTDD